MTRRPSARARRDDLVVRLPGGAPALAVEVLRPWRPSTRRPGELLADPAEPARGSAAAPRWTSSSGSISSWVLMARGGRPGRAGRAGIAVDDAAVVDGDAEGEAERGAQQGERPQERSHPQPQAGTWALSAEHFGGHGAEAPARGRSACGLPPLSGGSISTGTAGSEGAPRGEEASFRPSAPGGEGLRPGARMTGGLRPRKSKHHLTYRLRCGPERDRLRGVGVAPRARAGAQDDLEG